MSVSYYRLYLNRQDVITVVELGQGDEDDYKQDRFIPDRYGQRLTFATEEKAVLHLNERFQAEYIDEQYQRGENTEWFREMEKPEWRKG